MLLCLLGAVGLLALVGAGTGGSERNATSPNPWHPASWSAVVLPDLQGYSGSDEGVEVLSCMLDWVRANRDALHIRVVLQVGDLVNNNSADQWERIRRCFTRLDGVLPYMMCLGNHDLGWGGRANTRKTLFNRYFRLSENSSNEVVYGGGLFPGRLENAWFRLRAGQEEIIILALEFGPRRIVLDWARSVLRRFRERPLWVLVHEYMDRRSALLSGDGMATRSTPLTPANAHLYWLGGTNEPACCGSEVWQHLLRRHPGTEFVFSGHYYCWDKGPLGFFVSRQGIASSYRLDHRPGARSVHQLMFNAQWIKNGGDGWLRILEFLPDGHRVRVRTFSPYLWQKTRDPNRSWRRDREHRFLLRRWRNETAPLPGYNRQYTRPPAPGAG